MGALQVLVIESLFGTFGNLGKMRFIIPILVIVTGAHSWRNWRPAPKEHTFEKHGCGADGYLWTATSESRLYTSSAVP
jgi:hypothetical protein